MQISPINNSYSNHSKPSFGTLLEHKINININSYKNYNETGFAKILGLDNIEFNYLKPLLNNPEFAKLAELLEAKGKALIIRQWYTAHDYADHIGLYESGFWRQKEIATIDSESLRDNRNLPLRIEMFSINDIKNYDLTAHKHKLPKQTNKMNFIQRLFGFFNKQS